MKAYRNELIALVVVFVTMVGAFSLIPSHMPIWVRGGAAFVIALLLLSAYLVLRKPDNVLDLEESLRNSSRFAGEISEIAAEFSRDQLSVPLSGIAGKLAHVATKCVTRDLVTIGVQIRRLERVGKDVLGILPILTGETKLRSGSDEISKIQKSTIPGVLKTLDEIELQIDEVQAKNYEAADDDLETLNQLTNLSSGTEEAVDMLKKIIKGT